MLCWVESVRIQIKVRVFQWQGGNGYVNTQVLTSICIKLCKHIHLLRSVHRSSSLSRALLKHCSNLFGSRFIIQVLCSEPGWRENTGGQCVNSTCQSARDDSRPILTLRDTTDIYKSTRGLCLRQLTTLQCPEYSQTDLIFDSSFQRNFVLWFIQQGDFCLIKELHGGDISYSIFRGGRRHVNECRISTI